MRFKVARRDGRVLNAQPEFDDLAKLAAERGIPIKDVQALGAQGVARTMKFFLTTAIDFVNSRPHLGTAYEKITADIIARYRRLAGFDDPFPDGQRRALAERVPQGGRSRGRIRSPTATRWSRCSATCGSASTSRSTTSSAPPTASATFPPSRRWRRPVSTTATSTRARTRAGTASAARRSSRRRTSSTGNCPIHKTKPQWIKEKNWFFRLSKYQQPLLKHYADHPSFIEPEIRRNEILRLVEGGLEDISMSRAGQSWGIPVPFDPTSVVYVWFDALINYAAAVGYGWDDELFKKWWPANLHIVGKDITRFHCVIWPAMLMSAQRAAARRRCSATAGCISRASA